MECEIFVRRLHHLNRCPTDASVRLRRWQLTAKNSVTGPRIDILSSSKHSSSVRDDSLVFLTGFDPIYVGFVRICDASRVETTLVRPVVDGLLVRGDVRRKPQAYSIGTVSGAPKAFG